VADAGRSYLRGVLGDGVNDVDLRADWRRRGGLCPRHWRVWRGLDSPALSSTVLLRDLLSTALEGAPPPARGGRTGWGRRRSAPAPDGAPVVRCPACELEAKAERRYLDALARLTPPRLEAVLRDGRGFACLGHLAALPAGPVREQLAARLPELLDDLDTFLRLSDHRFAGEPMGEAGDAWLRAIRVLGGDV
jgi:hypothetical protein